MASTLKMFDNGTPEVSDPLSGFASIVRSIWQGVVCLAVELAGCSGRFPQLVGDGRSSIGAIPKLLCAHS